MWQKVKAGMGEFQIQAFEVCYIKNTSSILNVVLNYIFVNRI